MGKAFLCYFNGMFYSKFDNKVNHYTRSLTALLNIATAVLQQIYSKIFSYSIIYKYRGATVL